MTEEVGPALPEVVRQRLDGDGLSPTGTAAYIAVTADADCRVRICMLGAGEIFAVGHDRLRLALWRTSRSLANLERGSELVLCVIAPDVPYYVRARPTQTWGVDEEAMAVELTVESVLSDSHPGFRVTGGIQVEADPAMAHELHDRSLGLLATLRAGPPLADPAE